MSWLIIINNGKTIAITMLIILAVWFYKDYGFQKSENKRQTENMRQIRLKDSLKYAQLEYSKKEIESYLNHQNTLLRDKLDQNNIKLSRIQRIINQKLDYQDLESRTIDLDPVVQAIGDKEAIRYPIIDSTECLTIKGYVDFSGDSLTLDIIERTFKNTTDIVAHLERREWKFLGIKTRFLGKKQAIVKTFDQCGESKTLIIDNKNKK